MAVLTYKCPNCDGPLTWNGQKEKFVCDYCKSAYTEAELEALQPAEAQGETVDAPEAAGQGTGSAGGGYGASAAGMAGAVGSGTAGAGIGNAGQGTAAGTASAQGAAAQSEPSHAKMRLYNCPSCGAQITAEGTTAASVCYYCHNPIVLMDKLTDEYTPDFVIPFAIDKKKATEIFTGWVKQHKYVPKDFYDQQQIERLSGVYFPYWVYNCRIRSDIRGTAKKVRTWDEMGMRNTETSVYDISDTGNMEINDLSRIALGKASKVLCESVMPFELDKMKKFQPGYLQGYVAETRDIQKDQIAPEIKKEVEEYAVSELRAKVGAGFNSVDIESLDHKVTNEQYRYALMPVWTVTYRDRKGDMYYFSINGQTGKTCGELPVDNGGLIRLFLTVFIPMLIALLALLWFLG